MSNDLIVMDNSIVTSAYNLTLNEQRLIYCALKQIPKGVPLDPETAFYITRDDFLAFGVNPDTVAREIRHATTQLLKKTIVVPREDGDLEFQWLSEVLRVDRTAEQRLREKYPNPEDHRKYLHGLRTYNLLDSLPNRRDDDNIVARIVFHKRIVPLLSDLRASFTQFALADVTEFSSIYTFRIYQLLMQYKSTGYVKISLDDLRFMLVLFDKYPLVADLKRWVVETAVNEINEKSPYKVKYEMLKKGRKFTHLELKFKLKESAKKLIAERDPNTIDWVNGQTDNEAQQTKVPSWQTKGLSDAQIKKIGVKHIITDLIAFESYVNTQEFDTAKQLREQYLKDHPDINISYNAFLETLRRIKWSFKKRPRSLSKPIY
jgi:pterin-4a-carbinolamine dehydratase